MTRIFPIAPLFAPLVVSAANPYTARFGSSIVEPRTDPVKRLEAISTPEKPLTLPTVDYDKLAKGDPVAIKSMGESFATYGVVAVTNPMRPELMANLRNLGHTLFKTPTKTLAPYSFTDQFENFDFVNHENHRGFVNGLTTHHLIPCEADLEQGSTSTQPSHNFKYLYSHLTWFLHSHNNIYPPKSLFPTAKPVLEQAQQGFRKVAETVTRGVETHLKDDCQVFSKLIQHPKDSFSGDSFKLIYYPAASQELLSKFPSKNKFYRMFEHTDRSSLMTFVLNADVPGLELKLPQADGNYRWTPVKAQNKDDILVFVGGKGNLLSENRYKEIPHRIVGNRHQMQQPRFTVSYFLKPNLLAPWPSLQKATPLIYKGIPLKNGLQYALAAQNKTSAQEYQQHLAKQWMGYYELKEKIASLNKQPPSAKLEQTV